MSHLVGFQLTTREGNGAMVDWPPDIPVGQDDTVGFDCADGTVRFFLNGAEVARAPWAEVARPVPDVAPPADGYVPPSGFEPW